MKKVKKTITTKKIVKGAKTLKEKLGKKEMTVYKDILETLREDTLQRLQELENSALNTSQRDQSGDLSGYSIHMADVASDTSEQTKNLEIIKNEEEILDDIDDAIERIKRGHFGICVSCKDVIPKSRLDVKVYAKYCLKCKEEMENSKSFKKQRK